VNKSHITGILSPLLQERRFKKALPFIRGNHILDIGCSLGEIIKHLPACIDYIGIEGDSALCRLASNLNPKHTFINQYIDGNNTVPLLIPLQDTILMLSLIEHLNYPAEMLGNLRKYLSNHGRIIITTPTNYSKYILKIGSKFRIFSPESFKEHKNHFSKAELTSLCEKSGYKIIQYSRFELFFNQLIILE